MSDLLPDDYTVNVSEIINLEEAYFVGKFFNVEATINIISSISYMIIVFFHTPESMKNFKKLMLFYAINVMVADLGAVCLRFTLLMPFRIIFTLGILGSLNTWQSFVALYFTAFGITNTLDTLFSFIWTLLVVGCIYMGIRIGLGFYMLHYGYKFGKTLNNHFSKRTQGGLMMMLRALIVQAIIIAFVAVIPMAILVFCLVFVPKVPQILLLACECVLGLYPTLDIWSSIIVIHPYRAAVVRFFTSGRIRPVKIINRDSISKTQIARNSVVHIII
ncbi:hypothetical protein FO519_006307 [Halicephalobus sp. NKZ332]|nr:hypothetical protein FO519_006307 [Halicephalobus sp. NKZ332]